MRVLVATDGSRAGVAAVKFAARLAHGDRDGRLIVLTVEPMAAALAELAARKRRRCSMESRAEAAAGRTSGPISRRVRPPRGRSARGDLAGGRPAPCGHRRRRQRRPRHSGRMGRRRYRPAPDLRGPPAGSGRPGAAPASSRVAGPRGFAEAVYAMSSSTSRPHVPQTDEALDRIARSGEAVFAIDSSDRIILWNKKCEELLGRPARAVLGKRCYDVMAGRDENGNVYCYRSCPVAHQARDLRTIRCSASRSVDTGKGGRRSVEARFSRSPRITRRCRRSSTCSATEPRRRRRSNVISPRASRSASRCGPWRPKTAVVELRRGRGDPSIPCRGTSTAAIARKLFIAPSPCGTTSRTCCTSSTFIPSSRPSFTPTSTA